MCDFEYNRLTNDLGFTDEEAKQTIDNRREQDARVAADLDQHDVLDRIDRDLRHAIRFGAQGEPSEAMLDWVYEAEKSSYDLLCHLKGRCPSNLEHADAMFALGFRAEMQGKRAKTGRAYKAALLRRARRIATRASR